MTELGSNREEKRKQPSNIPAARGRFRLNKPLGCVFVGCGVTLVFMGMASWIDNVVPDDPDSNVAGQSAAGRPSASSTPTTSSNRILKSVEALCSEGDLEYPHPHSEIKIELEDLQNFDFGENVVLDIWIGEGQFSPKNLVNSITKDTDPKKTGYTAHGVIGSSTDQIGIVIVNEGSYQAMITKRASTTERPSLKKILEEQTITIPVCPGAPSYKLYPTPSPFPRNFNPVPPKGSGNIRFLEHFGKNNMFNLPSGNFRVNGYKRSAA